MRLVRHKQVLCVYTDTFRLGKEVYGNLKMSCPRTCRVFQLSPSPPRFGCISSIVWGIFSCVCACVCSWPWAEDNSRALCVPTWTWCPPLRSWKEQWSELGAELAHPEPSRDPHHEGEWMLVNPHSATGTARCKRNIYPQALTLEEHFLSHILFWSYSRRVLPNPGDLHCKWDD